MPVISLFHYRHDNYQPFRYIIAETLSYHIQVGKEHDLRTKKRTWTLPPLPLTSTLDNMLMLCSENVELD